MSNSNNFRPTQHEIDTVSKRARRDAFKGSVIGGIGGALVGGKLKKKLVGALAGGITGNVAGRAIGRHEGARDVVKSRQALLQNMSARLDVLETHSLARLGGDDAGDDWYQDRVAQARLAVRKKYGPAMERAMSNEQCLAAVERRGDDNDASYMPGVFHRADDVTDFDAPGRRDSLGNSNEINHDGQHPVRVYPKVCKPYTVDGVDYQGEYELSPSRLALIEKYGIGIVTAIPEDQLSEEACKRLADAFLAKMRRADSPGGGVAYGEDFERKYFSAKLGADVVSRMGKAEIHAHFVAAQRNGLIELSDNQNTTDFFDDRLRSQSGTFLPGGSLNPQAARRAYSTNPKERSTGKTIASTAGSAAVLAGALLASKKLRRAKVPRLNPRTIDVESSPVKFARRTMPQSPFPGGPLKLVKRPKRGGKLLPWMGTATVIPAKRLMAANGQKAGQSFRSPQPMLPTQNTFGAGNLAGSLAEGAIDALGLGGATDPKRKKKVLVDKFGNPINPPTPLPDPGMTSTSSFAIGPLASSILRDGGIIAGADLTAEELHDAITKARAKKKQKQNIRGGIEATPPGGGMMPTTMSALHETLMEFEYGKERVDRAKRNGTTVAAAGAGGVVGAVGGLKYDQGSPVSHSDLKPGDRVYRRFGPGGLFQHSGIVSQDGRIVHRTAGSPQYRAIKPDSFAKTGKAPTYRENNPADVSRAKAAKNASKAAGTRAGKYCVGSNNCQTAVERIASKGKPVSGQLRRAGLGAAIGAAGAGSLAEILKHRRQQTQK